MALRLLQDGEALLSSTKNYFFNYVDRMRTHGALTQPDDCAPAVGKCANNPAISCTTANENERCEIGTSEEDNHEQRWCRPDGNGFCWNPITGIDQNAPCTLENEQTVCAAYEGKRCAITHIAGYGILFGPDGHGDCIKDTDPSDGIGRFPQMDTAGRGSGYHESWLTIAMENYYYGDSH